MKGTIMAIKTNLKNYSQYGFIKGDDGESYYYDDRFIASGTEFNDFCVGDTVLFNPISIKDGKNVQIVLNIMME